MAREFQKRDKHVKMSRDGLVDKNLATGEEQRASQRGQDFQLGKSAAPQDTTSFRETLSRGNARSHARQSAPQSSASPVDNITAYTTDSTQSAENFEHPTGIRQDDAPIRPYKSAQSSENTSLLPQHAAGVSASRSKTCRNDLKPAAHEHSAQRTSAYQSRFVEESPRTEMSAPTTVPPVAATTTETPTTTERPTEVVRPLDQPMERPSYEIPAIKPAAPESSEGIVRPIADHPPGRLRFDENPPSASSTAGKSAQAGTTYTRKFAKDNAARGASASDAPRESTGGTSTSSERSAHEHGPRTSSDATQPPTKSPKLHFAADEKPPDAYTGKLKKAHNKAERTSHKLDTAKKRLPKKHKIKLEKQVDSASGKAVRKLRFDTQVKTQRQHIKGALPLRPVKAGGNAAIAYGHKKMYQVEHENVGTEAAHKTELAVEGGLRGAYRLHKTAPYRRVAKLERLTMKRNVNLSYQKALAENPKLKSNLISRMAQKQKIKRQYAKAAREAKRAGSAAKKTANAVEKTVVRIVAAVKNHPAVFGVIAGLALLIFFIMTAFSSCSQMATGGLSTIIGSSYLAEDADVDNAELAYTGWETDLQMQVNNAESTHSGYDEYRYNVGDIGHDPYELMAYLTAKYQNFTFAAVEADLRAIFAEQYQLSFVPEIEIRYADPNDSDDDGDYEPYEWHILNVNLTSRSFTDIISPRLTPDQREINDLLMQTKGNRQYALSPFDFNWMPLVTDYYGWRVHPITGAKDYHKGIDIGVPIGTQIVATHDGVVSAVGYDAGGYGNYVVIDGKNGLQTKYAHCDSVSVSIGQEVKKGNPISKSGNTGNSTGPHLHFEVIKNGQFLNPLFFSETNDDGSGRIPPGSPGGVNFPDYPGAPLDDARFAAMIEEGEKHLGKAYVFGASGPANFDCSGFVSWVLDKSGVHPMSRTNAQTIYNFCTLVSPDDVQPGDLIFFTGTYSTPNACSHIGIYVGNGMMLHCGDPVQYTSIETRYWRDHFYSFARIPN